MHFGCFVTAETRLTCVIHCVFCVQEMQRPRYFTASEVAAHNTAADFWVSFLGKVCDLSPLMSRYEGERGLFTDRDCVYQVKHELVCVCGGFSQVNYGLFSYLSGFCVSN